MSAETTSRRARIAVVGAGGWSQGWHMPNLSTREDAEIAAIVDSAQAPSSTYNQNMKPITELSSFYGGVPTFTSIDELLADAQLASTIDGVLCATNHATHAEVGLKALAAGKHVMMEKPMTTDVQEARALYDAAQAHPELCFVINNTANWAPGAVRAAELVAEGRLGEIQHVNCMLAAPLTFLFETPTNDTWVKATGSMKGNGFGWGQFSHTFAWVFKTTGLTPLRVYAVCGTSKKSGADIHDALTITCTNGSTISATGVGTIPGASKLCGFWLFGSKGMLTFSGLAGSHNADVDGAAVPRLELVCHDGTTEQGPAFEFEHLSQTGTGPGSMDALVNTCLGKPYNIAAGAAEGIKAVATIEAMYRSALSGLPEDVADACGA